MEYYLLDTSLSTVCDNTDPHGINCSISNHNPFDIISNSSSQTSTNVRRAFPSNQNNIKHHKVVNNIRRRMLNDKYSYRLQYDPNNTNRLLLNQSWWEGRIDTESVHFCCIFSLTLGETSCEYMNQDFADKLLTEWQNTIDDNENVFLAYGMFDVLASEMADNFANYLINSLTNNENSKSMFISMFNNNIEKLNSTLIQQISDYFTLYYILVNSPGTPINIIDNDIDMNQNCSYDDLLSAQVTMALLVFSASIFIIVIIYKIKFK